MEYMIPVPVEELPLVQGGNTEYRRFDYKIQVEVSGAGFDLRLVANGEVVARQNLVVRTD